MKKTKVKKYERKNSRGITLIALVITIIVLLILAGVSIATLIGENGILTQAGTAKETNKKKETIERVQLDILGVQSENYGKITKEQFREILVKYFEEDSIPTLEELSDDISTATQTLIAKEEYGSYEIKISDIWNSTFSNEGSNGKTVLELYDGINDENDANYNENAIHIGDWVNYTAENWEESVATPTSSTPFTFGGYTAGKSRDENASGTYKYREGNYQGWRIWDIDEENGTMTLISAGCPEVYYHSLKTNSTYISEYILTGKINENVKDLDLGLSTTYKQRDWSVYENEKLYVMKESARVMAKSDLDLWYEKYVNSSITDAWDIYISANTSNKLLSIIENGYYYWMYELDGWQGHSLTYMDYSVDGANYLTMGSNHGYGVRVLVSLTSEAKFNEIPEKIEKDGFTYNKWTIESK